MQDADSPNPDGTDSSGESAGCEGGTVEVWWYGGFEGEHAFIQEHVESFSQDSGVEVELEFKDWARQREEVLAAVTAGRGPDIVHVHNKLAAEFGESGDLVALDDLADFDAFSDNFVDGYMDATTFDSNHYGIPNYALQFGMGINRAVLEEAGADVPSDDWTWEEFEALAAQITENTDAVGFTFPGGANLDDAYRWASFLHAAGGRVLDESWTSPVFNDEAGVAALEFLLGMKEQGLIPEGNASFAFGENMDLFGSGRAAMTLEGPWLQGTVETQYDMSADDLAVVAMPKADPAPGDNAPGTLLDMSMYSILDVGDNPACAWELIKHLKSPELDLQQTDPSVTSGLPVTKGAYEEGTDWGFLGREAYLAGADTATEWPKHPRITEIQETIGQALNAAWTGSLGAKEALDRAAEDVQAILDASN